MPRKPDKRIREAKEMFLKGARLVDISAKLNVPEGTVRRWKSTHKWDSERSDRKSERSDKKRGGQPGNKNAEGHGVIRQIKRCLFRQIKTGLLWCLIMV